MFKKNSAFETKFIHKLFIWTIFRSSSKTLLSNKNVRVMPLADIKKKYEICFLAYEQYSSTNLKQIYPQAIYGQYLN